MPSAPQATVGNSTAPDGAGIPPARHGIAKRTLTRSNAFNTLASAVISTPLMFAALFRPKISAALREKLFLAVSVINDCRLCKWGHTHWAMAKGVPLEEVNQILGLQTESLAANSPSEAAAILFAQHYAEQLGRIDPESIENLRKYYSKVEVAEIQAYVRFMMLTNLTGNTLDGLWTRVRGPRIQGSGNKPTIAAAASPVALLPTQQAKFNCQVGMEELRSESRATAHLNSDTRQVSS